MRLDPLLYAHSLTGAVMPVTTDLLPETYLAPLADASDIGGALADPLAPWAESLPIASTETQGTVERALRGVMQPTPGLDPAELTLDCLPRSRAKRHLEALRNVWAATDTLPGELTVIRHVLSCDAEQAVAPLPVLDLGDDPSSTPAEAALAAQLCRHHGAAPSARLEAWRARRPQGAAAGAISHVRRNLVGGAPTVARDATLGFFALRDSMAEAQFAAALSRRMLDDGSAAQPSDIALLVPETPTRLAHLAEAFADQGVPLSGLPEAAGLRDLAGEVAILALRCLRAPGPAMALASRPDIADALPTATGLDAATLAAIAALVAALKEWLDREGYPDLYLEVPIHVTHTDGSETLGILDAVAMGLGRMLVVDHKTGPAPDPRARFASYWPQLAAYANALRLTFPTHQVRGVAIHWMNEGILSFLPLEPEVVA